MWHSLLCLFGLRYLLSYILWNPVTSEFKFALYESLYAQNVPIHKDLNGASGFGFDPKTSDFKLVVLHWFSGTHTEYWSVVEIYCPKIIVGKLWK